MRVRSLGLRSELFIARDCRVDDRGDYLAVKTPSNPTYYWGNYLLFAQGPAAGSMQAWEALFVREFGELPEVRHRAFAWDVGEDPMLDPTAPRVVDEFAVQGLEYEVSVVLCAEDVGPPMHPRYDLDYRPLVNDSDWVQLLEMDLEHSKSESYGQDSKRYRRFAERKQASYRASIAAGQGVWFAAFEGPQMVSAAGLFWNDGLGRFQHVLTRASHRRRGICGTLIHVLSRHGLDHGSLSRLVIVADHGEPPERVYRSLGYAPVERYGSFQRGDGSAAAVDDGLDADAAPSA